MCSHVQRWLYIPNPIFHSMMMMENLYETQSTLSSSSSSSMSYHKPCIIPLNSTQAIKIHGWMNPKCILSWEHITTSKGKITAKKCLLDAMIPAAQLKKVQPDPKKWVEYDLVDFTDVPHMIQWPLCPIRHLGGDISTLIQYGYEPEVLQEIGIDYDFLKTQVSK